MKENKKPTYREDLLERLKNSEYAETYLNAALEDDDKRVFLLALRDVADAYGGMTELARLSKISREHMYRMLSEKGNPEFTSLKNLLNAVSLKLAIETKDQDIKAA
jgi:probable addiction module antidote protein